VKQPWAGTPGNVGNFVTKDNQGRSYVNQGQNTPPSQGMFGKVVSGPVQPQPGHGPEQSQYYGTASIGTKFKPAYDPNERQSPVNVSTWNPMADVLGRPWTGGTSSPYFDTGR
jgi:hypothetical protein